MLKTILLGIIGLDIVVLVHELGHFFAAKLSGVEVEAFSIGMGKKLLFFSYRGTEYRLSMLPVGGYCKMKGEEQFSRALKEKDTSIPYEKGSLFSVSPFKRIFTYLAGPLANFLFSVVVLSLIWLSGFSINTYSNKIILVSDYPEVYHSTGNPADKGGLKSGDTIIKIEDSRITNYSQIQDIVYQSPGKPLTFSVNREGKEIQLTITPALDKDSGAGKIGVAPYIEPVIENVKPASTSSIAGLKKGDRILEANGEKVENYLDLLKVVAARPKLLKLKVLSGGILMDKTLIPVYNDSGMADLGISFRPLTISKGRTGPVDSFKNGTLESVDNFLLTIKSLGLLFTGVHLDKAVSGPIRITYFVGEVATEGFKNGIKAGLTNLFRFLSVISIALCFANLLPIPIFDGGLILFTLITIIRRKGVNPVTFYRYQSVGMFILLVIFLLTTFGDISFLFSRG